MEVAPAKVRTQINYPRVLGFLTDLPLKNCLLGFTSKISLHFYANFDHLEKPYKIGVLMLGSGVTVLGF